MAARDPAEPAAARAYVCYVLESTDGRRTYCGITNNPARRIRQHNGEISGGAKYTRGRRWSYAFRVVGFRDKREALSFEWHLKHRTRCQWRRRRRRRTDRVATALGRREAARDALLALPRWAHLRRADGVARRLTPPHPGSVAPPLIPDGESGRALVPPADVATLPAIVQLEAGQAGDDPGEHRQADLGQ